VSRNPKVSCALPSNVHTYRLLIFKELCSVLLAEEALCSSAKRQDYEAFRMFRQALHFLLFSRNTQHLHAPFCGEANYSKSCCRWQG
ncbi:hypothetical protein, partial [Duganella sp. Dugasp56]|uniref:hypothetical protein n=1 Tax=Duganella sp. Dugasp56 TaxID=3243046 RepID=UPI0039B11091